MITLRDPAQIAAVVDDAIRHLLSRRFAQLSPERPYDAETLGVFIVVEVGDDLAEIDRQIGLPTLTGLFDDSRFGESDDFVPCNELLEEHSGFFEMVFVTNDDQYATTVIVPKTDGIQPELLAMCRRFASPVHEIAD